MVKNISLVFLQSHNYIQKCIRFNLKTSFLFPINSAAVGSCWRTSLCWGSAFLASFSISTGRACLSKLVWSNSPVWCESSDCSHLLCAALVPKGVLMHEKETKRETLLQMYSNTCASLVPATCVNYVRSSRRQVSPWEFLWHLVCCTATWAKTARKHTVSQQIHAGYAVTGQCCVQCNACVLWFPALRLDGQQHSTDEVHSKHQ